MKTRYIILAKDTKYGQFWVWTKPDASCTCDYKKTVTSLFTKKEANLIIKGFSGPIFKIVAMRF